MMVRGLFWLVLLQLFGVALNHWLLPMLPTALVSVVVFFTSASVPPSMLVSPVYILAAESCSRPASFLFRLLPSQFAKE